MNEVCSGDSPKGAESFARDGLRLNPCGSSNRRGCMDQKVEGSIVELDLEAWDRWLNYRKHVKKKPIYDEDSQKAKLMRLGAKSEGGQMAVVEQSIDSAWTGLFEVKLSKPMPGAAPKRTAEQQAKADADFARQQSWSNIGWDKLIKTDPLAKLRLCDALLARYQLEEGSIAADKIEWLKERAGAFLREADPAAVLADFSLRRLVLIFWPKNGLQRLRSLVEQKVAA